MLGPQCRSWSNAINWVRATGRERAIHAPKRFNSTSLVLAITTLLTLTPTAHAQSLPDYATTRAQYRASDVRLLDRDGRVLHEQRRDMKVRRLDWLPLSEISPAFLDALIVSEDQRFFDHAGVDWKAMASAAVDNLMAPSGKRPRGASTLTMQLAGLLRDDIAPRAEGRSWGQKWDQVGAARELEGKWNKAQILEAYVNLVTFRGELQGMDAAARGVFGKHAAGLDMGESLILAALLRSPNAKPAQVAQRACGLRVKIQRGPECERLKELADETLKRPQTIRSEYSQAPHFARRVINDAALKNATKKDGYLQLASTLDGDLQRAANNALQRHLLELGGRGVEDGAVIVLDNASGDVLAWVGSSGALSRAGELDGVTALRQAGSTLKPFLYGQAIEQRLMTAASLIDDAPLNIDTQIGVYTPGNYDGGFKGLVSARVALAGSLNVPAVKTLQRVGPETFRRKLLDFGLDSLTESGDYYGYSLALGSADVSLVALTNGYRALANGGRWTPVRGVPLEASATAARQAMSPAAAWIVGDMLSDNGARAITFGTDSLLATRVWTAVKTGTSKDMRDNWCVGYSSRFTVGVWVGNFSGAPMRDVSGVTGAAPIWAELMNHLHTGLPSTQPARPAGVLETAIRYEPALEPARNEMFLAGTEQAVIELRSQSAVRPRITYPTPGLIVAVDPDIPPAYQRVPVELSHLEGVAALRVNDQEMPLARRNYWPPTRGKHRVALLDAKGEVMAEVRFEVR